MIRYLTPNVSFAAHGVAQIPIASQSKIQRVHVREHIHQNGPLRLSQASPTQFIYQPAHSCLLLLRDPELPRVALAFGIHGVDDI